MILIQREAAVELKVIYTFCHISYTLLAGDMFLEITLSWKPEIHNL